MMNSSIKIRRILTTNVRQLTIKSTLNAANINNVNVMNVFDRKAKLLHRERAAKDDNVKLYDYIKDEIGYRLSDRVFDIKREFNVALELGCGRGYVSKNQLGDSIKKFILADMSPTYVEQALPSDDYQFNTEKLVLDEENFTLDEDSIDLVISCLSLHWINDLPGCFSKIIHCLKNDGVFIGAIFGGDTLYQLRSSLQLAEIERTGGLSPHISPFTQIRDIGGLMNQAGFTMLTIDCDELVIGYPSMFELMWDLKGKIRKGLINWQVDKLIDWACDDLGMAENNASWNRTLHLKRDVMLSASAIYDELYGKEKEDGSRYVPATFQVIYMLGWKPDPSQPKPIARGSGEISLKELYKLDQIIRDAKKVDIDDKDK